MSKPMPKNISTYNNPYNSDTEKDKYDQYCSIYANNFIKRHEKKLMEGITDK
jgi:hypothetical protein